jgi:hypothetical protein
MTTVATFKKCNFYVFTHMVSKTTFVEWRYVLMINDNLLYKYTFYIKRNKLKNQLYDLFV